MRYQVKPGYTHGAFGQYQAGDVVEMTEAEALGFLDKLQPLAPEPVAPEPVEPEPVEADPVAPEATATDAPAESEKKSKK